MIEGVDLEINELCGGGDDIDDVIDSYAQEGNEDGVRNSDAENDGDTTATAKKAVKKIIRAPRPKLNPQRLMGERGISILPQIFSAVKLKGKGHEREDLDILMKTYEHWAHRLFPAFTFQDTLDRIEKLGAKKEIQTYVKRIRLDLDVFQSDHLDDDKDTDREDNGDAPGEKDNEVHQSLFDAIAENASQPVASSSQEAQTLTDEQRERIERNRLLALEKRKARMAALEQPEGQGPARCENEGLPAESPVDCQDEETVAGRAGCQNKELTADSSDDCRNLPPAVSAEVSHLSDDGILDIPKCGTGGNSADILLEDELLAAMEDGYQECH